MGINLNESGEQSTGMAAIPPNSRVLVKLSIQYPKTGRQGQTYPLTRSSQSSLEYLATQLEVCTGTFAGKKIFHNFKLSGAATDGQHKAVDISMRTMRALVEAARGISPKDSSPQATQARVLNAWTDVEGSIFPATIGCELSQPNKDGKVFVHNTLKRVVTLDEAEYQQLRAGGEIITEEALPDPDAKNAAAGNAATPLPAWATPQGQGTPPVPAAPNTSSAGTGLPAWAQPAAATPPPPMSAVPPPAWNQPPFDTAPF